MGARLTAAIVVASLALAVPASAGGTLDVEIVGESSALDTAKLDALVTLELGADLSRVSRLRVDVRGARADVTLNVDDERRTGSIAVAASEPERALALFVAELAHGAVSKPPAAASVPNARASRDATPRPAAQSTPPRPASSVPWRVSLLGTVGARLVTSHGSLVATPRIEVGAQGGALRLGAIARYGYASSDDALGTVTAHAAAGGLAATYVLVTGRALTLSTGPRIEIGVAAGRGSGNNGVNGTSTSALLLAGAWEIELRWTLGAASLLGTVEAGSIIRGFELRADDRNVLDLAGPFVGAAVGAAL